MSINQFFCEVSKVLRCYNKALQLDPKCTKLWMEYGNLAYRIGSHASHLRKISLFSSSISQVPDSAMMAENEILQAKQTEMLRISKYCFESANKTQDEKDLWVRYLMLGKIAERFDPLQALKHYQHADLCMYMYLYREDRAWQYAIEAVKIHYRIHAVVLKRLTNGKKVSLPFLREVKHHLLQALRSPLVIHHNNREYNQPEEMQEDEYEDRSRMYDQETGDQREASVSELMNDMLDLVSDEEKNGSEAIENLKQDIISMCIVAMKRCVALYPGHYKALFRLAHYFHTISRDDIAKGLLLNRFQEGQIFNDPMASIDLLPGIFAKRTNTDIFFAIWHIRINEIARHGSFQSQMFRCTLLLKGL